MKAYNKDLVSNARTLRKNMTPEEKHLWYDLLKRFPINVYRQHNIGNYIVDFYVPQKNIVIEIDGIQHLMKENSEKDQVRDEYLLQQNLKVLRYSNESIRKNFADVCEDILINCGLNLEDLKEISR